MKVFLLLPAVVSIAVFGFNICYGGKVQIEVGSANGLDLFVGRVQLIKLHMNLTLLDFIGRVVKALFRSVRFVQLCD